MTEREPVVAIDGPAGSGKSTVARGVGAALALPVLDTGAMYRAVTLAALERAVDLGDETALARIARTCIIEADGGRVTVDGRDVAAAIRSRPVTDAVSRVAAHPAVRRELVARQREWLRANGAGIVEGRDIGTVVFPNATVKVFLTAHEEERARRRRHDEAVADREGTVAEEQRRMAERDRWDASRAVSPLTCAGDALVLDTTGRKPDEVVAEVVASWHERADSESPR